MSYNGDKFENCHMWRVIKASRCVKILNGVRLDRNGRDRRTVPWRTWVCEVRDVRKSQEKRLRRNG